MARWAHTMPTMAVLLLSATMQPLNVISKRRLLILLDKERIALLDEVAEREAEAALRERRLPRGIVLARLLRAVHVPLTNRVRPGAIARHHATA